MTDNLKLNKLISDYIRLTKEIDNLSSNKDKLKEQIIQEMGVEDSYENPIAKVNIQSSIGFKYTDEVSIINFLEKNGYEKYVIKKVDTDLNKKLKEDVESLKDLKPYYNKTITKKLTIKEK